MKLTTERFTRNKLLLAAGTGIVIVSCTISIVVLLQDGNADGFVGNKSGLAQVPRQSPSSNDDPAAISLDEFLNANFSANYFNGSWWSDTELQWSDKEGNLVAWDFTTNATTVIVSHDLLASVSEVPGARFVGFSPDNTMILFSYDIESVWRHSFTAKYLIFDTETNQTRTIASPNKEERLQYCDWIENDEDDNMLIYVFENNLYWRMDAKTDVDIQITKDGVIDNIFNGIPDWVYEEEVLATNYAHYFSPAGYKIAFAQFNDTLVPDFHYPNYGNPQDVINAQYPTYKTVRYPKSGQVNPTAKMFVRQVTEEMNKEVVPPQEVLDWGEFIYTDVNWVSDDVLSMVWMNRIQNESAVCVCQEAATTWTCSVMHMSKQENGWIEPGAPMFFNDAGTELITTLPSLQIDNLHYAHVAKIGLDGKVVFLTSGLMVVTNILSWDQQNHAVYFMATYNGSGDRHLYSVDDMGKKNFITCLTCNLPSSWDGVTVCDYNDVMINSENTHYVHICRGQVIPEVNLRKLTDGTIVHTLEDNSALREKLSTKTLPTIVHTGYPVEAGWFTAPVKIYLPRNLVPGQKYPLLVGVYGGPGSQLVDKRWSVGYPDYLATSRNIVYAIIDGRGTGFQSNEYKFKVYRNLGTVEMEDQIEVTRKLLEAYDFIDATKVGIWGWSYGGFATAMTLERDGGESPVFSCGISVAPVTSFLLYDSVYTERYMGLPLENAAGYNNNVISGIENLRSKKWMLNHGVADDNVHFQHSMLLTSAMERADIQFEQHSYPDENHSLGGVKRFLYHAMDDFWTRCFSL